MADALVSPPVAAVAGAVSIALIAIASRKITKENNEGSIPLMGVLGAFVFAAQMINFTIPGTGSSGHIIGGVLLAAVLGRWRAFITICSVLIVQCLVFADGGLMALGCNIINMGAMSCLVAYPLVFKPIVKANPTPARLMWASVLACIVGLEAGALLVSVQTVASGVTSLPFSEFLLFMLPIHLAIGAVEGIATGAVLVFVLKESPSLLQAEAGAARKASAKRRMRTILAFAIAALAMAVAFFWIASENPDGLEWSIMKITGDTELAPAAAPATAFMPDYSSHFAGVVGGIIVMAMLWAVSMIMFHRKKSKVRA